MRTDGTVGAARLGIQRSDVVLEITAARSERCRTAADAADVEAGEMVEVCVNRRGKKMMLWAEKVVAPGDGDGHQGNGDQGR